MMRIEYLYRLVTKASHLGENVVQIHFGGVNTRGHEGQNFLNLISARAIGILVSLQKAIHNAVQYVTVVCTSMHITPINL